MKERILEIKNKKIYLNLSEDVKEALSSLFCIICGISIFLGIVIGFWDLIILSFELLFHGAISLISSNAEICSKPLSAITILDLLQLIFSAFIGFCVFIFLAAIWDSFFAEEEYTY